MRKEDGYSERRRSKIGIQFVLLGVFLAVIVGAVWLSDDGATELSPSLSSTPASPR